MNQHRTMGMRTGIRMQMYSTAWVRRSIALYAFLFVCLMFFCVPCSMFRVPCISFVNVRISPLKLINYITHVNICHWHSNQRRYSMNARFYLTLQTFWISNNKRRKCIELMKRFHFPFELFIFFNDLIFRFIWIFCLPGLFSYIRF